MLDTLETEITLKWNLTCTKILINPVGLRIHFLSMNGNESATVCLRLLNYTSVKVMSRLFESLLTTLTVSEG